MQLLLHYYGVALNIVVVISVQLAIVSHSVMHCKKSHYIKKPKLLLKLHFFSPTENPRKKIITYFFFFKTKVFQPRFVLHFLDDNDNTDKLVL